jgi:hypothetical protein
VIDASQFAALSQTYTIQVVVASLTDSRTASASRAVMPVMGNPPTGRIQQFCGLDLVTKAPLPCPVKQNRDKDVQLVLLPDVGYSGVAVRWSMVDAAALQEGANAQGVTTTTLSGEGLLLGLAHGFLMLVFDPLLGWMSLLAPTLAWPLISITRMHTASYHRAPAPLLMPHRF